MRVVVALGGNALLERGQQFDSDAQRSNVARAAAAIAQIAREHEVVVTHGNGPQIGFLALQSEAMTAVAPTSLDVLGAESEGMIGYLIDQALANELPDRRVVTLLTQVVVDASDPAFRKPTKPIGPVYRRDEAERHASARGWVVAADGGGYRRVVASPEPLRIVELDAIELLSDAGVIVVCAGGGGIPVVELPDRTRRGVEAVIDKDLSAALLGEQLNADALLLLTDVPAVEVGWRTPGARRLRRASPESLRAHTFDAGSMGPKIKAACRFVASTGRTAGVGALGDAPAILAGEAGTTVTAAALDAEYWGLDRPRPTMAP